ncbi:MAG TPA: cupin [Gammaproteobacteria bacterium]|nr:cupin [Gammaproteobacteria bacterium]
MKAETNPYNLASTYLRLRSDVSVEPLEVDEAFWRTIAAGDLGSFHNEFLVTSHTMKSDWDHWEMHPHGDEIVCLLDGNVTFLLEEGDGVSTVELKEGGAFAIVPTGTWHTAKVKTPSRMLFITAGEGTQHRPV